MDKVKNSGRGWERGRFGWDGEERRRVKAGTIGLDSLPCLTSVTEHHKLSRKVIGSVHDHNGSDYIQLTCPKIWGM